MTLGGLVQSTNSKRYLKMGGGKGGSAPAAPDYDKLMELDSKNQMMAAQAITGWNRPTQNNPYGSMEWEKSGPDTSSLDSQIAALKEQQRTGNASAYQNRAPKPTRKTVVGGGDNAQRQADRRYEQELQRWKRGDGKYSSKAVGDKELQSQIDALNEERQGLIDDPNSYSWTQNEVWDPQVKEDMDRAMGISRNAQQALENQGAFQAPDMINRDDYNGDSVADAIYESVMGRARPEQERERESIDLRLRQQGLQPGTEAYDRAMTNLMTAHGDVATQAGYQATIGGGEEARAQYASALRGQQQDYNQSLQNYTLPWEQAQQAQNLVNSQYRPTFQGFSGATGYSPGSMTNAAQAGYNAQMGQHNAEQQKKGNIMNAGVGLGSAALLASDATLKQEILPLEDPISKLMSIKGVTWKWVGLENPDAGVIAQEVAEKLPELTEKAQNGVLGVNYTGLFAILLEAYKELSNAK
jgi:hypothetical protein